MGSKISPSCTFCCRCFYFITPTDSQQLHWINVNKAFDWNNQPILSDKQISFYSACLLCTIYALVQLRNCNWIGLHKTTRFKSIRITVAQLWSMNAKASLFHCVVEAFSQWAACLSRLAILLSWCNRSSSSISSLPSSNDHHKRYTRPHLWATSPYSRCDAASAVINLRYCSSIYLASRWLLRRYK